MTQCVWRGQKMAARSRFSLYHVGPKYETKVWPQVPLSAKSSHWPFCFKYLITKHKTCSGRHMTMSRLPMAFSWKWQQWPWISPTYFPGDSPDPA